LDLVPRNNGVVQTRRDIAIALLKEKGMTAFTYEQMVSCNYLLDRCVQLAAGDPRKNEMFVIMLTGWAMDTDAIRRNMYQHWGR
jgi:hypothetical protein